MSECLECMKHEAIERELEQVKQQCTKNDAQINLLMIANAKSDTNYNYIISTLNELKGKIEGVLDKPRQRIDYLFVGSISLIGSIVSGAILFYLLKR